MSRIGPASQPAVEPAVSRFGAAGYDGAAPFGAVLRSFGQAADSEGLGTLPSPNEGGATAFDALGMFEGGKNPDGDRLETPASDGPVADDDDGQENASPESDPLAAPMPFVVIGAVTDETDAEQLAGLAGITTDSILSAGASSAGSQLAGRALRPVLPVLQPTEHGLSLRAGTVADVADAGGEASPSTLPSAACVMTREKSQKAAAVTVVLQADEGLPAATVSARGSALDDEKSEGLADKVRVLLARHGLVLGSLRVNGRSASGGFTNEDRG